MMLRILTLNGLKPDTHIVFANTGKEREETLVFVNECAKRWNLPIVWIESIVNPAKGEGVGFRIVTFETASRNGEPFEQLISKFGLPNRVSRFCTGDLKIKPMKKYMQSLGYDRWQIAMGIRADEPNRLRQFAGEPYTVEHPLNDWGISVQHVNEFWAYNKQGFDLGLKSYEGNCDLCHLKSLKKKRQIIRDKPAVTGWWEKQERRTGSQFDATCTVSQLKRATLSAPMFFDSLVENLDIACFCGD